MEVDPAGKTNDGGLNQKREGCMRQGEIAIGHLPEGDTRGAVKNVAQVPKNGQMRVLPQNNSGCGQKQAGSGEPVTKRPMRLS